MFMKTIAVGPREDVASWVTGGTGVASLTAGGAGVAKPRVCDGHAVAGASFEAVACDAAFVSWRVAFLNAMTK